jgi:hypothetical protein
MEMKWRARPIPPTAAGHRRLYKGPAKRRLPQASAPDKTVTTGQECTSAYVKKKVVADFRVGGSEQISEDIVRYSRTEPMTAPIVATGVDLVVGMLLILARK